MKSESCVRGSITVRVGSGDGTGWLWCREVSFGDGVPNSTVPTYKSMVTYWCFVRSYPVWNLVSCTENNNYLFRHFLCVLCRNSVGQSDCSIQINLLLHDKPCQLSRETAAHVLSAMKENTYFWCRWPIFWSPRGPLSHILTQFYGEVGTKQQWRSYNHNMLWVGSTLFNNN